MTGRDDRGRFASSNPWARAGGQARARALTPERRREIARAGWLALVELRFNGDATAAAAWLGKLGAWASDAPYRDLFPKFAHPGPCPAPNGNDLCGQMRAGGSDRPTFDRDPARIGPIPGPLPQHELQTTGARG